MPNPKCGPFDLKSLWQDSLRRALFARSTGLALGMTEAEDVFAAALLQDMAVPLLAKHLDGTYIELLEGRDDGRVRLSSLEQDRLGCNHAEAAAQLATRWNLPDELVEPIRNHIDAASIVDDVQNRRAEFAVAPVRATSRRRRQQVARPGRVRALLSDGVPRRRGRFARSVGADRRRFRRVRTGAESRNAGKIAHRLLRRSPRRRVARSLDRHRFRLEGRQPAMRRRRGTWPALGRPSGRPRIGPLGVVMRRRGSPNRHCP